MAADERDDPTLLQAWREGDRQAGEALMARHLPAVHRFFAATVPPGVAGELTQTTFEALVHGRDRIRDAAGLRHYLFGIARKQVLRHVERRTREGEIITPSQADLPAVSTTPSRRLARAEEQDVLRDVLARLSPAHREVLALYYWDEHGLPEIAARLGVAVGTIKSRLARAREAARALIEQAEAPGELRESVARLLDE